MDGHGGGGRLNNTAVVGCDVTECVYLVATGALLPGSMIVGRKGSASYQDDVGYTTQPDVIQGFS